MADFYTKTIALYERQFGVLQLIILAMVLLSVVNSVAMSTFERIGEFGTMMAMGNRSRDIFRLVLVENLLLALFGASFGAVLGVGMALIVSAVGIDMPPPPNMNEGYTAAVVLTATGVFGAAGVGFVATVLAALLPARRVSRIAVMDALRENA